ncbi:MAG: HAMP domain-containing histidine kinase [Flavobacteriaceae bacterium]|uniref:histidine kinase n=1 Tax=Flavobacterium kayseriense TaxID=2764714 RepID=A0ABR7J5C9_9FLAO|nr:HAMP domain-containing sensor histidine kinase [Flavobacterium kayseriense]MBC5840549.1 HAMP domain-containing histidine kinase [Flavobacterium kayseriense]MBC5846781.1 HAMP domain-containing histidine kinase [Flavobacterium kayseriense]MBU0942773.1 HAMP domain-containing histidine kinase [Bacteroidota bacterium]MBX9888525.1 HAMP domain-containing histidine kinase [Flavobacteriaceae bacterium]
MNIRKKVTFTYVALSTFSTLLLCVLVFIMFRKNNQYHFLKRLEDRAKIVASINFQNDPEKKRYYSNLKKNGLEELIQEEEYVLKVNSENSFEYNTKLDVPNEFYMHILESGKDWYEINDKYYLGQIFTENNQKYIVIVGARDRMGKNTLIFIVRIMFFGGIGFLLLAYFFGRLLARRVFYPVARITKEVKRISASNLHNRLPQVKNSPELSDLTDTFNGMLDRLETSFEIQANFINNASHELKTPITTIIAEAEIMLLKDRETEEYKQSLGNIYNQAARLGNLTESLLKLTQTGYDGKKQVQDIARIDEILLGVKSDIDKMYPDNRVIVKLNFAPSDSNLLLVPCNKPLLELAINNIITNGVKYSDNNEVFVILSADTEKIKITINDIGIGIPPEDIPHLYEPFFRGKIAAKYIGYGLGLPLAMKIIRMHEGELQVQSEENKGTIVTIVFKKANIKNFNVES